jgi:anti-sigma factor (TIGR02949 family)
MTCVEFRASLHPYVDGELAAGELAAANAHAAECPGCGSLARREREFRLLLRRQPREPAPPEVRARIVARMHDERRRLRAGRWLVGSAGAAVAAALVAALVGPARQPAPLVGDLVDKHIAFAQVDHPAELATADPREIARWFRQRAGLRVVVPDYSQSGIRLLGARLAEAHEQKAAYLLYEKGRTLLSVFMVPVSGREAPLSGTRTAYRGHEYVTTERKGYRSVSWTEGGTVFGLVSMLDYDALLECAARLRVEAARQTRAAEVGGAGQDAARASQLVSQ